MIGKSLLRSVDVADSVGEVIAVATALRCYVEPVHAAKEMHIEGEATAISVGDTNWAIINRALFCSCSLWSGTNLCIVNEVSVTMTSMCSFCSSHSYWLKSMCSFIIRPNFTLDYTSTR